MYLFVSSVFVEETAGVLDIACGVANSYYITTEGMVSYSNMHFIL